MSKNSITVLTPVAILSYPHLDAPQAPPKNPDGTQGAAKYSVGLVFEDGTDIKAIEAAILQVATAKWGDQAATKLRGGSLSNPLRCNPDDVADKRYPKGSCFINARSGNKPGLVHRFADPATVTEENPKGRPAKVADDKVRDTFYPGAKVRAQLSFYTYDKGVKKGVGVGLDNVQLIDGTTPRLDGRQAADEAFESDGVLQSADLADLEGGFTS